jgi:homoserine O-acetyltransferase
MTDRLEPTIEGDFTLPCDAPFRLVNGDILPSVTQRYAIYGTIAPRRDNVILVCHALSGSARVHDWWPQLFGRDRSFDLTRYAILGVNVLGSCYGSTGPSSINPATGERYGGSFPVVSIHDMVHAQARLAEHLKIERFHAVVGGSIGGMQALAWATEYPERVPRCVAVGACPLPTLGLALSHLQRQAIRNDPAFLGGDFSPDTPPTAGLSLARAIAMITYKSPELLEHRFGRKHDRSGEDPSTSQTGRFDIGGYLDYQGRSFCNRFDANSYLAVTRAMELFEFGDGPDEEARLLSRIRARTLLVGIRSDWMFPPSDIRALAYRMAAIGVDARYAEMESAHGHDGFLADSHELEPLLRPILEEESVTVAEQA